MYVRKAEVVFAGVMRDCTDRRPLALAAVAIMRIRRKDHKHLACTAAIISTVRGVIIIY